ncbi:MAG: putative secreted tripeptidyl aminopeptidase [Deltaproteobacteria bacterium]|nr:putative secreted tripeptidyl aminopeptidase [Deltaproteobacteria bacterium]
MNRGAIVRGAFALLLGSFTVAACGDNLDHDAGVDAGPDGPSDILVQLGTLPGVTVTEWAPPMGFPAEPGYRYFDLLFTQPIDHHDPSAGTFQQYVALMHRDVTAPFVIYTSGYDAGWTRFLTEPSQLLAADQISIEYRFYGQSRPEAIPWAKLTIEQAADDEHAILGALATIYTGKKIQTGGSKGGENAMHHMWSYPQDLDGVVAYVAPVITDNPDLRYATVLDDIGIPACRTALRAVQREMLIRHAAMESRALATSMFEIASVAHATETAIVELEFSFWMTRGEADCGEVPSPTATDDALFTFLDATGGPSGYDDAELATSGSQYIYQDQAQLGYPVWQHAHLDDLMQFSYEDWSAWDPWGAGYPAMATSADAIDLRVLHGSHWSSGIYSLGLEDQQAAVSALRRWAGLTAQAAAPEIQRPLASMASQGPSLALPADH